MGMDSEVLSPSEVAAMAPLREVPVTFPRWEPPTWAETQKEEIRDEEYFNADGKLIGGIRPFGNKWSAWRFNNTSTTDSVSHVVGIDLGVYYTREQAKGSVVAYAISLQ